jgi:hypothetical protein
VINKWVYIRVGLYLGGGAYIWNEVSVSTCGGLIHGGLIQGRRKVDNWGGADIHIFMFTDCKNNRFQRK